MKRYKFSHPMSTWQKAYTELVEVIDVCKSGYSRPGPEIEECLRDVSDEDAKKALYLALRCEIESQVEGAQQ